MCVHCECQSFNFFDATFFEGEVHDSNPVKIKLLFSTFFVKATNFFAVENTRYQKYCSKVLKETKNVCNKNFLGIYSAVKILKFKTKKTFISLPKFFTNCLEYLLLFNMQTVDKK